MLVALLLVIICSVITNAQRVCTTTDRMNERMSNDQDYIDFYNRVVIPSESDFANANRIPCDGNNSINVPIAFHFTGNYTCADDIACIMTEVQDQLDVLNASFASNVGTASEAACPAAYQDANGNSVASTGSCINFCYATPPVCSGLQECDLPITIGVGRDGTCWAGVLNIYITPGGCLGFADGIPGSANGDGVTVCAQGFGGFGGPSPGCGPGLDDDNTFDLGYTLVHEVGHYLGLFHVWGDGGCGITDTNAPGPINVSDTPDANSPSFGCPTGCQTSCGTPDPWANFMDYTDDGCMSMFTEDQAAVMNYWANQLFGNTATACGTATTLETCGTTVAECSVMPPSDCDADNGTIQLGNN